MKRPKILLWNAKSSSRAQILGLGLIFVVFGSLVILNSRAGSPLATPTGANSVVVQYSLGMAHKPVSTVNLQAPMTPPFTLYGNGLLICGQDSSMPFMSGHQMTMPETDTPALPTSAQLSPEQIQALIQEISDTGFFGLEKEYFKRPVAERQDRLRVSLLNEDHYVLYYNDVDAPAAYTKTIAILQGYCGKATTPYQPDSVVVRTLKAADPKGQATQPVEALDQGLQPTIRKGLENADTEYPKRHTTPSPAPAPITTPGETNQVVTGDAAKDMVRKLQKKPRRFIQDRGATYEVIVDVALPLITNKLHIDYKRIRGGKTANHIIPDAHAAVRTPVRVVYLLASDGGDTTQLARAQAAGQRVSTWYAEQIGTPFDYRGVVVIRGSQTRATYMACQTSDCGGPLGAMLDNILTYDDGTVFRTDMNTVVITGWPTGALQSNSSCGMAFVGWGLGVVDGFAPDSTSGAATYCPFHKNSAHELGHTFGLEHTSNGTLMDGSPFASARCDINPAAPAWLPPCVLDSSQIQSLKGTEWFIPSKLGDVNGDNRVNIQDLSILLSNWNKDYPGADFNANGKVDIFDLSVLLSRWEG
ncbi:MAG TPA: dockerin type I domain-containing protein [Candidatus Polarisedimenticolaceae bacterium]|nr:dockerin type I domain-containing protein [Candidatus Polarisedimenticolaceae bacterium]